MLFSRLLGGLICLLLVMGSAVDSNAPLHAASSHDSTVAVAATATAHFTRIPTPQATLPTTATVTPVPTASATAVPLARPQPDVTATHRVSTVPILMYHYISVPPRDADKYRMDLSVTPARFEAQLNYLARNGYTTVGLHDLVNHLSTGAPLPPKPVVLTFDDGYRDAYEHALPLLKKYGFIGTFFIVSDYVNNGLPAYLTWGMVKEMSAAGMSIESHSRSHPDLRNRSFEALVWQTLGPIEAITAYTGIRPRFFCYPSGRYDGDVMAVLRSVDTWAAVTTEPGRTQTLSNAMTWPRVRIHGGASLADFARLVH